MPLIARRRAAEHEILAGRFEVVVLDQERTRPVPSGDRLGVLAGGLHVGDVRPGDGGRRAVERDAALLAARGIAVDVAAIDDQIVGHAIEAGLREGAVAERQDVSGAGLVRSEFEEHDRPVMSARGGAQRRRPIRRLQPRQPASVLRPDALADLRQAFGCLGANRDVAGAALLRQDEVPGERRARRQFDDVSRNRTIEHRLKIASGGHLNGSAGLRQGDCPGGIQDPDRTQHHGSEDCETKGSHCSFVDFAGTGIVSAAESEIELSGRSPYSRRLLRRGRP